MSPPLSPWLWSGKEETQAAHNELTEKGEERRGGGQVCQLVSIWRLGQHGVVVGDSLEKPWGLGTKKPSSWGAPRARWGQETAHVTY